MIEGQKRSVLLKTILTLHRLEQNGNELRPLPGAVQTSNLGYQYCNLGCYLLDKHTRPEAKHKNNRKWLNRLECSTNRTTKDSFYLKFIIKSLEKTQVLLTHYLYANLSDVTVTHCQCFSKQWHVLHVPCPFSGYELNYTSSWSVCCVTLSHLHLL